MIYALFVTLIIIMFLMYLLNGRNILLPSFITSAVFLIGAIAYIICFHSYNYDISIDTFLIILFSIFSLYIGEMLTGFGKNRIIFTIGRKSDLISHNIEPSEYYSYKINIPKKITFIFLIIEIFAAVRYFEALRKIGKAIGYTGGLSMLISNTRGALTSSAYSIDTFTQILATFASAAAYLYCYYYIRDRLLFKKRNYLYLLIIAAYFVMQLFSTGRQGFIEIIVIILMETILILSNANQMSAFIGKAGKIFKYIIFALLAIALLFFLYGKYFRHSTNSFMQSLGEYVAAPIYGLDYYMSNKWPRNTLFGQYILKNYYYYFNKLGANYTLPSDHLPFFYIANSKSNIYTSLVLPLQDFGIFGLVLTRIIIGAIYSQLVCQSRRGEAKSIRRLMLKSCVVSYLYVAVFYSAIADKYKEILTVTAFPLMLLSMVVVNYICLRNGQQQIE